MTVISRDNLKDAAPIYRTVILDELSSFRTKGSVRWKNARRVTAKAEYVWGLTGTPAPNGYLGLWAQVFLLDRGKRLGTTLGGYRERYFRSHGQLPSGIPIDWRPRPEAEERIRGLLEDVCLYMSSADELDLPPVTYNVIPVPLPPAARKHYETLRADLVLDLELLGTYSAANAAVLTNKLAQVSAGFLYSDDQDGTYLPVHAAKLDALQEIVDGTGDNLLVFYNYIAEAQRIREVFPQARSLDDPGALAAWCRGEVPMLLAHPASAGHGLNLQGHCHTVVWTSLTWDLELWLQACGRINRQGQTHPVIIHTLEGERTIDGVIAARLKSKTFSQDALLDHLRSPI